MFTFSRGNNRFDNHPRRMTAASFDDFMDQILLDRTTLPKERAPYFSRTFGGDGFRCTENAEPAPWIALDVDHLELPAVPALNQILDRKRGFWYASHSASELNAKRRLVLELSRPVTTAELPRVTWAIESRIADRLGDAIRFDSDVSADAARLWYVPTVAAACGAFTGAVTDADRVLAMSPLPNAAERPTGVSARPDADLRQAVLAGEDGAVYQALLSLSARLIGRGMDPGDARSVLESLLGECTWRERNPRIWRERMDGIPGLIDSAVAQFARDRRAPALPAPVDRQAIHPGNGAGSGSVPTLTDIWPQLHTNSGGDKAINSFENAVKISRLVLDQSSTTVYRSIYHKRDFLIHGGIVREMTDRDALQIWEAISCLRSGLEKIGLETVEKAVTLIAARNERDEMMEWLETLRWDGTLRLDTLCEDAFGAKRSALNAAACKNMMIACVARQYVPGTKVDAALILCGPQGIGKTMALQALFGDDGVCPMPHDPTTPDAMMVTAGKLCMEMAELAALKRVRDIESLKAWMTVQTDEYRAPYAKRSERHKRRFIITGTTNAHEFLSDTTGNRRFIPMECGEINLDYIRNNRDQLFAEAIMLFRRGDSFWDVPRDEARMAQDARVIADPWQDAVTQWLVGRTEERAEDVLAHIVPQVIDRDPGQSVRIAACLRGAGWEPFRSRRDGRILRLWRPESRGVPAVTRQNPDSVTDGTRQASD